jgi:hypothetical protein
MLANTLPHVAPLDLVWGPSVLQAIHDHPVDAFATTGIWHVEKVRMHHPVVQVKLAVTCATGWRP